LFHESSRFCGRVAAACARRGSTVCMLPSGGGYQVATVPGAALFVVCRVHVAHCTR
jgi:hypothetical protein